MDDHESIAYDAGLEHGQRMYSELAESVLTFNEMYKQVMQGAWTRKIPSPEAMGQLRAARLEMVRQANKHIEQEQHDDQK